MLETLSNYLKTDSYRISLLKNKIHILNYKSIIDISNDEVLVKVEGTIVKIYGSDFKLLKLEKKELLINGSIKRIELDEK